MLTPLICGTFHPEQLEDDDELLINSPCSTTPKKSKKSNKNNNPYSTRGLDKFSALLADLEEKRQKIYLQKNSQEIDFVRFAFSSSNQIVPIVVKSKNPNKLHVQKEEQAADNTKTTKTAAGDTDVLDKYEVETTRHGSKNSNMKKSIWNFRLHNWRRPTYYVSAVVILILIFLALFGRSVAILCTSIGWYMIPSIQGEAASAIKKKDRTTKKTAKKKEYTRRLSERNMGSDNDGLVKKKELTRRFSDIKMESDRGLSSSPPKCWLNKNGGGGGGGDGKDKSLPSPRIVEHGHRKSW